MLENAVADGGDALERLARERGIATDTSLPRHSLQISGTAGLAFGQRGAERSVRLQPDGRGFARFHLWPAGRHDRAVRLEGRPQKFYKLAAAQVGSFLTASPAGRQ